MSVDDKRKLMDSLSDWQRKAIACVIRDADIEGDYRLDGENSVWCEDTTQTLACLANYFENYDPLSVID